MDIKLELGPTFHQTLRELGAMGESIKRGCSAGMLIGCKVVAGKVSRDYLSGQALKRRTGHLARAIEGWLDKPQVGAIGVKGNTAVDAYSWLLTDEEKTITPKKGKYLAIPIGENLTSAGVTKFASPRDVEGGFFIRKSGQLLFGYKRGKKGKFRAMFVLVKSVFIQGSGALYDGVLENVDDISDAMRTEINRRIGA